MGFQILNNADAAYAAMARWFSSDMAIVEAANEGYSVLSGGSVVAGTTAGTVKVSAGTDQFAGPINTYALTDNIACTANADATNPRWQLIEVDSTGAAQSNLGTAAANPVPPTPTTGRVVHAAVYIPAGATAVDALLSTVNGKAKIIDKRIVAAGNLLQTFSNAAVSVASTTRILLQTGTMSASRSITLPLANSVSPNTALVIVDQSGSVTATNNLLILMSGSDTINGGAFESIANAYGGCILVSDGVSAWTTPVLPIFAGGTSAPNQTNAADNLLLTTTQGDIPYRNATNVTRLGAGTSGQALITGGASANPAWGAVTNVQAFTASGTWTKPANATWVKVIAIGSGGGGGGGRLGQNGTARGGGGGGAAGNFIVNEFQAADLAGTATVTIPAGGAAGAGRGPSQTSTTGGSGGSPAATTFVSSATTFVSAAGGGGGVGGSTTGGTAGAASSDLIFPAASFNNALGPSSGAAGGLGAGAFGGSNPSYGSPGPGGGGGGITTGNVGDNAGGAGGGGGGLTNTGGAALAGGTAGSGVGGTGGDGNNSGTAPSSSLTGGSGGGGGANGSTAVATTVGGAGGKGGTWGAGGGGGGAGTWTTGVNGTSGAGGAGGKGYVIVISYR